MVSNLFKKKHFFNKEVIYIPFEIIFKIIRKMRKNNMRLK